MDIFVNNFKNIDKTISSPNSYPDYLILININTHFAILKHFDDKTCDSELSALKSMFNKIKIVFRESDEDKSFVSKKYLSYLDSCDIDY
ncbi:MAG: hypothetical protein Ta2E_01380 [Mycoplasmoidaceae bacterium]|nr:MAG: hypothetical protein Ta2E_01380 [Mycoplasmoidaceae bacterium]